MSGFVVGGLTSSVGPQPEISPQLGQHGVDSMQWVAADGRVFELLDNRRDIMMLEQGVEGLWEPQVEYFATKLPQWHGSVCTGWYANSRNVGWQLLVKSDTPGGWEPVAREFFSSMEYHRDGKWVVKSGGVKRWLSCRIVGEPFVYPNDPIRKGAVLIGVKLIAHDPWWRGEMVNSSWVNSSGGDGFLPAANRPGFTIGLSRTVSTAQLNNPGDVAATPIWELSGPFTAFKVGVTGSTIEGNITVAAGQVLRLDPGISGGATLAGVDVTNQCSRWGSTALPPGEVSTLQLDLTGNGRISVSFEALYRRGLA